MVSEPKMDPRCLREGGSSAQRLPPAEMTPNSALPAADVRLARCYIQLSSFPIIPQTEHSCFR